MLCKQETHGDPRACLKVGAAVSDCASEYFTAAINRCGEGIRFDPGHESGEAESKLSTEAGGLLLLGKGRRILILAPDTGKNKAPNSVSGLVQTDKRIIFLLSMS